MNSLLFLILVGIFVGAAAGYLGSFMVVKRMSLVGDALSHVALPGMAIALAFNFSPILGAFLALSLAVIGIWYLGETSNIYTEALVGIFFTASLAIGVLITPEVDLLEALFGNIENVNLIEGVAAIIISCFVIIVTRAISQKLILMVVSDDLAKASGITVSKINLIYLLLVGAVVALGVRFVGTLLMGALVIVPAASAKNIGRGIISYGIYSVIFGGISAALGVFVANVLNISSGPIVVLVSIAIFVITLFLKNGEKTC